MAETLKFRTSEICIHKRFEEIASAFPDSIAVHYADIRLSYSELNKLSNRLAYKIIEMLGEDPSPVAFFLENSHHQIIAILAILKAGKSYLPLDISFPYSRNAGMLDDAGCKLLISSDSFRDSTAQLCKERELMLVDEDVSAFPDTNPGLYIHPDSVAILLYTSGSTGKPKGVMQSHANMVNFIMRLTEISPVSINDKIAYYLSVGFSAHALPLLMGLLNGARLVVFNIRKDAFKGFRDMIFEHKITYVMMIPSFLRHLMASVESRKDLRSIRTLILGGETLFRSDIEKARRWLSRDVEIINIYASTETYVARAFIIKPDTPLKGNIIPIGYAVRDMDIEIVDEAGKTAAQGETGKILIKSKYVTQGYWNKPEMTARDIRPDKEHPERRVLHTSDKAYVVDNECMVHVGRSDAVVKLRGFRIDLAEIENILLGNDMVKEAACALKKNPQNASHIIGYVVASENVRFDMDIIRTTASRSLPDYMVPYTIITLDELPKNSSRKIDYAALPEPEWVKKVSSEHQREAKSLTEKELLEIFSKNLKTDDLGIDDDFLKIGADSLSLFLILSKIEKKYKVKLSVDDIMKHTSIESLALFIENVEKKS